MKCIVTGTRGYIGNLLAESLASKGYQVLEILGRSDFNTKLEMIDPHEEFDVVIHAGCSTEFVSKLDDDLDSENIQNTQKLIQKLNTLNKFPHLIITGAAGVFGVNSNEELIDENSTGSKNYFLKEYDKTKYIFDKKSQLKLLQEYKGHSSTLCLTTVFGKKMNQNTINFYKEIRKKKLILVPPGGTSFLGEKDLMRAIEEVIDKKITGTYIVSSGNLKFKDLFLMAKNSDSSFSFVFKIPYVFLYLFYFIHLVLLKIQAGIKLNVLISTFGYKYYSTDKFKSKAGWIPQDTLEVIFREIL
jgi:nucleoside-diphosphate-sugar epimerase